jgi:hypothetical protein
MMNDRHLVDEVGSVRSVRQGKRPGAGWVSSKAVPGKWSASLPLAFQSGWQSQCLAVNRIEALTQLPVQLFLDRGFLVGLLLSCQHQADGQQSCRGKTLLRQQHDSHPP